MDLVDFTTPELIQAWRRRIKGETGSDANRSSLRSSSNTQWVSEYYATPWVEFSRPQCRSISCIEQFLKITPQGRTHLEALSPRQSSGNQARALQLIADADEVKLTDLAAELGKAQASKAVRELQRDCLIETDQRAGSWFARPKQHRIVRLLRPYEEDVGAVDTPKTTPAQRRPGPLSQSAQCLKIAMRKRRHLGVNTLQKKGCRSVLRRFAGSAGKAVLPQVRSLNI